MITLQALLMGTNTIHDLVGRLQVAGLEAEHGELKTQHSRLRSAATLGEAQIAGLAGATGAGRADVSAAAPGSADAQHPLGQLWATVDAQALQVGFFPRISNVNRMEVQGKVYAIVGFVKGVYLRGYIRLRSADKLAMQQERQP